MLLSAEKDGSLWPRPYRPVACLALARRLGAPVLTADSAWSKLDQSLRPADDTRAKRLYRRLPSNDLSVGRRLQSGENVASGKPRSAIRGQ